MENPYKVLGVEPGASPEEIKRAYYALVKKYHPDRYTDNPLKDLAQEKLKQINEAYDTLTKKNGGEYQTAGQSSYSQTGTDNGTNQEEQFMRIRQMIAAGNVNMAMAILEKMTDRTAQWHYLTGICLLRRGFYAQASQHLDMAAAMEPDNDEYRQAVAGLRGGGAAYNQRTYRTGNDTDDLCRLCQCMICSDCCCESMGGQGLPCI